MTDQEYKEWRSHPVTQEVLNHLSNQRQDLLEAWAEGVYTKESMEGTVQLNSEALGKVKAISYMLSLDYEEIVND